MPIPHFLRYRQWVCRPSHSAAVAYLALFVALGGSSYAALQVTGGQIADNGVRSVDLRNNDVRGKDVRDGTLLGRDVRPDALGGAQILESTLGEVPSAAHARTASTATQADSAAEALKAGDADTLDGLNASEFQAGAGATSSGASTVTVNGSSRNDVIARTPGLLSVRGICTDTPSGEAVRLGIGNEGDEPLRFFEDAKSATGTIGVGFGSVGPGNARFGPELTAPGQGDRLIWTVESGGQRAVIVAFSHRTDNGSNSSTCQFQAHVTTSR